MSPAHPQVLHYWMSFTPEEARAKFLSLAAYHGWPPIAVAGVCVSGEAAYRARVGHATPTELVHASGQFSDRPRSAGEPDDEDAEDLDEDDADEGGEG